MSANDPSPTTVPPSQGAEEAPVTRDVSSSDAFPATRIVDELQPINIGETAGQTLDSPHTTLREETSPSGGPFPSISGYEILSEIGRGGMGVVYKARQIQLKRLVAIKMLLTRRASEQERTHFKAEAEAVARLQHPNIVQIYEVGECEGQPYFSLEYVDGGSLDRHTRANPQPPREAAVLMRTIALAMDAAHEKQIIHRDLKPANILIVARDPLSVDRQEQSASSRTTDHGPLATMTPKVTDFGLAKHLDADVKQTSPGSVMGTPAYMAPEQARGRVKEIGPWTDVYALGVMLYELLTGRPPFTGQDATEILDQVREHDPLPPRKLQPRCPRDLEIICLKCLQKKAKARYPRACDLADDLQRWLEKRPILARPASVGERLVKWVRRSPGKAASAVAMIGFIVLLLVVLSINLRAARTDAELTQRKLREEQRRANVRREFEDLFARAGKTAAGAAKEDANAWLEVKNTTQTALALLANDPALADTTLRDPVQRLLERAEGELANARERDAVRNRLTQLKQHHGDAVFFATLFSGLEVDKNHDRVRKAVNAGLERFALSPEGEEALVVDGRFFNEAEKAGITGRCYELLLLDAEALSQARPGEKVADFHERLKVALKRIDRAERLGLRTHAAQTRRADWLTQLGQLDHARQASEAADTTLPNTAVDCFLTGLDRYRQFGREGEDRLLMDAARLLVSALRLQPDHYGAMYVLGLCRLRQGNWQEARLYLSDCWKHRPDFRWPLLLRGFASMRLNDPTAAEGDFQEVLDNLPDDMARYMALVSRAVLRAYQQQYDTAITDLRQAIALNPNAYTAHLNLALIYKKRGEPPVWREALLLLGSPSASVSTAALGQQRREYWSLAVAELGLAIKRRPDIGSLYSERARLHLLLGNEVAARDDLARAVVLAPGAATLVNDLLELARLLQQSKEYSKSLIAYDAVLKLRPDLAEVRRLRAESHRLMRQYRQAAEDLDHYLTSAPARDRTPEEMSRRMEAHKVRGLLHSRAGDDRAAIASYTQGLQMKKDAELLALRGWAYLYTGAPGLAKDDFDDALTLRSGAADCLIGRADAQVKLGKVSEGINDVEEGVRRGPPTWPLLYKAARVPAQASLRLRDTAVDSAQRRAVELLEAAFNLIPRKDQPEIWREYVEKDTVFTPLQRNPAMVRLRERVHLP